MKIEEFKKYVASRMCKGWIAMDKNKRWYWYLDKPIKNKRYNYWEENKRAEATRLDDIFYIEALEDWEKSLFKVGKHETRN